MAAVCLTTAYFPPISYVSAMVRADAVFVEQWEHYQKQSYRNRCHIVSTNGVMPLSIPVERNDTGKAFTRDIRISEHDNWRHRHWQSIVSAYGMSPFFEYYEDDLAPFYHKKWDFLLDFNMEIMAKVLELLQMEQEIKLTDGYCGILANNVVDLREEFHPKNQLPHTGKEYYQVFNGKHGFLPDMSVIDLLFNMGNESVLYL